MARRKTRRARWGAETHTDVQQSSAPRKAILSACANQTAPAPVPGPADSVYARLARVPAWEEPAPAPEPHVTQRTPGLERLARCGWTVKRVVNAPSGTTRREREGYFWTGGAGRDAVKHTRRHRPFAAS